MGMENRTKLVMGVFGLIVLAALVTDFQNHIKRKMQERVKPRPELSESYLEVKCRAKWPLLAERYENCMGNLLVARGDL